MELKRNTVEQDLAAGPLITQELFFKNYGAMLERKGISDSCSDESHIIVELYKYRIFISRYDTTAQVWDVVGEAFHQIRVESGRYFIERDMKLSGDEQLMEFISRRCKGPLGVEKWLEFCHKKGYDITINEGGPIRDDIIARLFKIKR